MNIILTSMDDVAVKYVAIEKVNTNQNQSIQLEDQQKEKLEEIEKKHKEEIEKQQEAWKKIYISNAEDLELSGGWIILIGTLFSAFGETRNLAESESGIKSVILGNSVEAFGNTLQAIGLGKLYDIEGKQPFLTGSVGCWLQAGGNATNAVATTMVEEGEEIPGFRLNAIGSSVQSYGAYLEGYANTQREYFYEKETLITGNYLIALGSALDAIGQVYLLQEQEEAGGIIIAIGAWVQVIGAYLEVYAISTAIQYNEMEEQRKSIDEQNRYAYSLYRGGR